MGEGSENTFEEEVVRDYEPSPLDIQQELGIKELRKTSLVEPGVGSEKFFNDLMTYGGMGDQSNTGIQKDEVGSCDADFIHHICICISWRCFINVYITLYQVWSDVEAGQEHDSFGYDDYDNSEPKSLNQLVNMYAQLQKQADLSESEDPTENEY